MTSRNSKNKSKTSNKNGTKARVEIYTTNYCGYCHAAKRLLESKGVGYTEIDVTQDPDKRVWLRQTSGQSTVPQIFWNGQSVGGYTELVRALPYLLN